jgi:hypothetical protein
MTHILLTNCGTLNNISRSLGEQKGGAYGSSARQ